MARAVTSPLAAYIDHLKRNELGYQFSLSANQAVFYPRVIAPRTGADDLEQACYRLVPMCWSDIRSSCV